MPPITDVRIFAASRHELDRIKEIGGLKIRMTAVEESIAQVDLSIAGVNRRIDRIDARLDRIERRLDLAEAPH